MRSESEMGCKQALRLFALWMSLLVFVIVGIFTFALLGAFTIVVPFLIYDPYQSGPDTWLKMLAIAGVLIVAMSIGTYLFSLLWIVCMRPFFTASEVASVIFAYGYEWTWPPERWMFAKLYPEYNKDWPLDDR